MEQKSRMRKVWAVGAFVALILAFPGASLRAEEEKPTGDMSASVLNRYVWRGYELSRNSVVIQPSITVGYKGFTANLWGNLDTTPYDSTGTTNYSNTWNETDLTLSYTQSLGLFNLGAGYIYYSLAAPAPGAADPDDSQEVFATVSLDTLLAPTLTIYKEIAHYHNWYVLLGISHAIKFNKRVSLKLAASASYLLSSDADDYAKYDSATKTTDKYNDFHDGTVSASLPIKITDYVTLTPMISYVFPLTGEAKDEMKARAIAGTAWDDRESSFLVGGLNFDFCF